MHDIAEKEIRRIADSSEIVNRGRRYFLNGNVGALRFSKGTITAEVKGNYGTYDVEIEIEGNRVADYFCDCPYNGDGCKHIVAVLYKFLSVKDRLIKGQEQCNKPEKGALQWLKDIPIGQIRKTTCIENMAKALELADAKAVHLKSIDKCGVTACVHDKGQRNVVIGPSDEYWGGALFEARCDCGRGFYSEKCEHIVAVIFAALKQAGREGEVLKYEANLRNLLKRQSFHSLVGCLDNLGQEEAAPGRGHSFFIKAAKMYGNIALSIEKAQKLKSGSLGKGSVASCKAVLENSNAFSEKENSAFTLFMHSLQEGGYYCAYRSNAKMIKHKFDSAIDSELFSRLRELYSESPGSFMGCAFPQSKARIEIALAKDTGAKRSYIFRLSAAIGDKSFPLMQGGYGIMGQNPLWLCIFGKEGGGHMFAEMECRQPEAVKALLAHNGACISSGKVKEFAVKYMQKLSGLGDIALPEGISAEEICIEPKPRIFITEQGGATFIELRFLYETEEAAYGRGGDIIASRNGRLCRIKRDISKEKEWLGILLENGAEARGEALFVSDLQSWLADNGVRLASKGFEVYGADRLFKRKVRFDEAVLHIEVSSGIDWFDLKGEANFGGEKLPLSSVMQAINNNERFVKLSDGTEGIIPKKWIDSLSYASAMVQYDEKEKKARAAKTQIALVETLLGIADKKSSDEGFNKFKEKFENFREIKEAPLPAEFKGELREYQKAGYNWMHFLKEFSFGGCLADDMGLGKTAQVLCMLLHEKGQGIKAPSLIVVPTSLVFNWVNEVKKFAPSLEVYVHHGQERLRSIRDILKKGADLIITTYGTLRNDAEIFRETQFHYIVLDESQSIKNPLSKNSKSVFGLKSGHRLVLTGTPIENNTMELWSQFAFLNPGLLGSMERFKRTFASRIETGKDKAKAETLKAILNPFLLCRKKENVAKELPEKQITLLYCKMKPKQREVYDYWRERFRDEIKETIRAQGFMQSRMKILAGLTKLRQICNHPLLVDESFTGDSGKFNILIDNILNVIEGGHKCLIFSSFVKTLHIFRDYFTKNNISFSYLDGSTTNRKNVVETFQSNNEIKVFLISLKAGGLGLNLTAADYVFVVDPWWNPAAEMQAIDRAHRIGQDKKVFVYKAITKDSVEEKILEMQQKKLDLVKNIITVEDGIFKALDREDILALFGH
ncbi:MAG: DEAD/DEAH box helicase [Nanoarchaeota archaeon]|nr:DEAD/DEAH box helicase [Nanoarchaeota archaeon]